VGLVTEDQEYLLLVLATEELLEVEPEIQDLRRQVLMVDQEKVHLEAEAKQESMFHLNLLQLICGHLDNQEA